MGESQKFKCRVCGVLHGGVYSPNVCQDCYKKGHRRIAIPAISLALGLIVLAFTFGL